MTPPPDQTVSEATVEQLERDLEWAWQQSQATCTNGSDTKGSPWGLALERIVTFARQRFTRPPVVDGLAADVAHLAEIIRTRLMGVHPDDQDVQLEDSDWKMILEALQGPSQARDVGLTEACDQHGAIEVWAVGDGLGWRPLNSHEPCRILTALSRPAPETTASDDVVMVELEREIERVTNTGPAAALDYVRIPLHTAAKIRAILANLPKPTEQATSPAPDAVLREALADLTDAFLSRHGCFPLDKVSEEQRHWHRAMKRAYELVGQPNTPERLAALASSKPTGEGERAVEVERERCARIAEREAGVYSEDGEGDAWIALRIAAAIRSGDKAEGGA